MSLQNWLFLAFCCLFAGLLFSLQSELKTVEAEAR